MPIAYLKPVSAGDSAQWDSNTFGSASWQVTCDLRDLTYASSVTVGHKDLHYVEALPASATGITQVDVSVRFLATAGNLFGAQARGLCKLGGTTLNSDTFDADNTGNYTTYTDTDIARPGGGSWLPADFAASTIQAGYEVVTCNPLDELHVSEVWLAVTYTEGTEPFPTPNITLTMTRDPDLTLTMTRTAAISVALGDSTDG